MDKKKPRDNFDDKLHDYLNLKQTTQIFIFFKILQTTTIIESMDTLWIRNIHFSFYSKYNIQERIHPPSKHIHTPY